MNLLDLVDMLELDAETRSPTSPIKLVTTGKIIGLKEGNRVIDFGCGCGEALALWGKYFGITGVGIDGDQRFCERAVDRVAQEGLSEQIEIVYGNAAEYDFEEHAYDMASCISASMIWGGFRPSIRRMKAAIHSEGKVVIGEPYYTRRDVPPELIEYEGHYHTELELFEIAARAHQAATAALFVERGVDPFINLDDTNAPWNLADEATKKAIEKWQTEYAWLAPVLKLRPQGFFLVGLGFGFSRGSCP